MTGDLHCHTKKSDGSLQPEVLVDLAAKLKVPCIAITDHETMDGVVPAKKRADLVGIQLLPGIEVTGFDYKNGKKVHVLCYLPKKPKPLLDFCNETNARRNQATLEMIEKVSTRYPIDVDIVRKYAKGCPALYKQHIVLALMDMGYSLSLFGELYTSLFSSKAGGWALVEFKQPDVREAFSIIKETGGAAVLAHPGVYDNFDIIEELCDMGLDGIEVFHPRQSESDTLRALEATAKHNLIRTGGSDFHGMTASKVNPLCTKMTEGEELEKLLKTFG